MNSPLFQTFLNLLLTWTFCGVGLYSQAQVVSTQMQSLPSHTQLILADGKSCEIERLGRGQTIQYWKDGATHLATVVDVNEAVRRQQLLRIYVRSLEASPSNDMVPARELTVFSNTRIQSATGNKKAKEIQKGEQLYWYDPQSGTFRLYEVGLVHREARATVKTFQLVTDESLPAKESMLLSSHR